MKQKRKSRKIIILGKYPPQDIQFEICYWNNTAGNAIELYINKEMVISRNLKLYPDLNSHIRDIFKK